MDATLSRLVSFIGAGGAHKDMELACAAAKVLGALGGSEAPVRKALEKLLASPNETLAHYALSALAPAAGPEILDRVVGRLAANPPLSSDAAAFVTRHLEKAAPLLVKALADRNPRQAQAALKLLAGLPSGKLDPAALLPALKGGDTALIQEATAVIRERLAGLSAAKQAPFAKKLKAFSERKEVRASPDTLTACVKILGAALPAGDLGELLTYTAPTHPTRIRRNAFFALAEQELSKVPKAKTARIVQTALAALAEEPAIAEAAAELLKKFMPEKSWRSGLAAGLDKEGPARKFALWAAERLPAKEAIEFLLPTFSHQDGEFRHAAARALGQMNGVARALMIRVDKKLDNAAAWGIGEALKNARARLSEADKKLLRDRLLMLLSKNDPAAEVLVDVAREAAPEIVGPALLKKALEQKDPERRREGLKKTLRVWPDAREAKLALALADIREGKKDLAPAARSSDKGLATLSGLARTETDAKETAELLGREKSLSAEELYYIGFHFAERSGPEGALGRAVLKTLLKRFPKHAQAAAAANKLKLAPRD